MTFVPSLVRLGRAGGFSAEAEQFFARLSTPPSSARKALYDALVRALAGNGVWSKLDVLHVYAAADQTTALTNLVQASYAGTAVNAPAFTADQGFTGASTKYIDTNFNPSSAPSTRYGLASACVFAWGDRVAGNAGGLAGVVSGSLVQLYPRWTDNTFYGALHNSSIANIVMQAQSDGSGFRAIARTAGNVLTGYKDNGAVIGTNSNSPTLTLPNAKLSVLQDSGNYYTGGKAYAFGCGQGLTASEVGVIFTALHAYLQAVAGLT